MKDKENLQARSKQVYQTIDLLHDLLRSQHQNDDHDNIDAEELIIGTAHHSNSIKSLNSSPRSTSNSIRNAHYT